MQFLSKLKRVLGVPEDDFMPEDTQEETYAENTDSNNYYSESYDNSPRSEHRGSSYNSTYGYTGAGRNYRESSRRESRRAARAESAQDYRAKPIRDEQYVNINATTQLQVMLVKADEFSECPQIADHLKFQKTVLLNVEGVDRETVRRIVDFLSGVAYGLGGTLKRVSNATFIITPYDVNIMGDVLDELKMERSIF